MKKIRLPRRSVSPFGVVATASLDPLSALKQMHFDHSQRLIPLMENVLAAPANDVVGLVELCRWLVDERDVFFSLGVSETLFEAMEYVFNSKTEDFFMSDSVLFSKERDILVGRYFTPITENQPGQFSGFLTRWVESSRPDRLLHFLDFCKGTNNPTFEYFLVFSHPSFHRILTNKPLLRGLLHKVEPLLKKLQIPQWESDIRLALAI